MRYIDLRSDTVMQPTEEMREAMYAVPAQDSPDGEDPTVRRLEALSAQVTGKEAGLFLASGTMANQVAVMTHTLRGDEMLIAAGGYMVVHEVGAAAVLAGVTVRAVPCEDDMLTPALIEKNIAPAGRKTLVCLENALSNGRVMPLDQMKSCYDAAHAAGMPVHLDGARLFNAATALGVPAAQVCRYTDSVMFCLTKGLCAPVGSMLCGSAEFIERARGNRQLLGGVMRQPGLLAACGIIAVEKMTLRLMDDHINAQALAKGIAEIRGVTVRPVETNMVFFTLARPRSLIDSLPALMLGKGIKINGEEAGTLRFVTNNDVTAEDVQYVIRAFREVAG